MTHRPDDDPSTAGSRFAVETGITRRLEDEHSRATLEVTPKATTDQTLLVGFGGHWGTTTTELTPSQARELASALEHAASHLEATAAAPADGQSSTSTTISTGETTIETNSQESRTTPDAPIEQPEDTDE